MDKKQPQWLMPQSTAPTLSIFNTLTRTKTPFIPQNGPNVTWYSCGPTVYDASHMGHARSYITFDILRRLMEDYFGFNVLYVMNITDIDDKIIVRARQNFLLKNFDGTKAEIEEIFKRFLKEKFEIESLKCLQGQLSTLKITDEKSFLNIETARKVDLALSSDLALPDLIVQAAEIISPHLDQTLGHTVTDQKIFRQLSAYWENSFLQDMKALNVKPADVMTRVSEYVPEIVASIEKIIANGYAYETGGSVYFDCQKFQKCGHSYAKLCPWSAGNSKLTDEGEGSLSLGAGKKDPNDFALWKKSKTGEPVWASPWSSGRPGWHIECSAMANSVLPGTIDIHSGGIDLAFPHHDNELAQSEGMLDCAQWINYFLHAGHLNIEGQKMSKSLKNFVTIQEALQTWTSRQIRLMFLMHSWNSLLDYKDSSMQAAKALESIFFNFLSTCDALVLESEKNQSESDGTHRHHEPEKTLLAELLQTQSKVHEALCDSFDTPQVIKLLKDLVLCSNKYISGGSPSASVLQKINCFVHKMFRIFGLIETHAAEQSQDLEAMTLASTYRDQVRQLALEKSDHAKFLELSDKFRDQALDLGFSIEDRDNGTALVRLRSTSEPVFDPKSEQREILRKKNSERLAKGKQSPGDLYKMFKCDAEGIPTHELDGTEITKSRRKKLVKDFEAQSKLHAEYLKSTE